MKFVFVFTFNFLSLATILSDCKQILNEEEINITGGYLPDLKTNYVIPYIFVYPHVRIFIYISES